MCGADLCVDQGVVEKDEPVDGEPPGVLQGQSFVAALADQPAVRLPQRVLTTHNDTIQRYVTSCDTARTQFYSDSNGQQVYFTVILPGKLFQKWKV